MNFTAIDFETATSKYTSICSIGICVVENNKVVEQREILVKPEPYEFDEFTIKIHGITPGQVVNCGTFNKYWKEFKPYLDGRLVIAHNTSFDINVLRETLDMFGLEYPTFDYMCTVQLSQKAYPDLESHKLNALSEALGIDFNHHHAGDDSYACAMALIHILEDYKLNSAEELSKRFDVGIGHLYPGYVPPKKKNKNHKKKQAV